MAEMKGTESEKLDDITKPITDQILATIYGQCIGDALGLLTEFMTKAEAEEEYGRKPKDLQYSQKITDYHRLRWKEGDWTDDTDQMIVILQSILCNRGEVVATDFAERIKRWMTKGFPEFGDFAGLGIGKTTSIVLRLPEFTCDPHKAAFEYWDRGQRQVASNGAVMRTSILGLHQYYDLESVIKNAADIGKTTHYDPRCQASVVAVSVCIALMLQHSAAQTKGKPRPLKVNHLIQESYDRASKFLSTAEERKELWFYMKCTKLKKLKLDEPEKIGYVYKCLGAGFWALKQDNFKKAMIKLVMQGGDADTNGAVAGALLACRLGLDAIPEPWISGLRYREWLMGYYHRFLKLQSEMKLPIERRTPHDDLTITALDAAVEEKRKQEADERKKSGLYT